MPLAVATGVLGRDDLSAVTAPSLVVAGGHDLADFRQIAAELSNRLPGARHLELPWAGHLPSRERPDELNPVLLDFLNGTLATR